MKIRLTCNQCNKPFERVISRIERTTLCPHCFCRVPFNLKRKDSDGLTEQDKRQVEEIAKTIGINNIHNNKGG